MAKGDRIKTVEETIVALEAQVEELDTQMSSLQNKSIELRKKINDLKDMAVMDSLLEYCMHPDNCYSFVVTFVPQLDYHCDLITVYRVLSVETDSWGPCYRCVVSTLHLSDHDMWFKSKVENISGTTLLHIMKNNEVVLTNKETAVDELLLKMLNCCPTHSTYKEYKSIILDKDCRTYASQTYNR